MATSGKPFIPMVSSTPPPIDDGFEDDDDEDFGSFATAGLGKSSIENDRQFKPIDNISSDNPSVPATAKSGGDAIDRDNDEFSSFASFDGDQSNSKSQPDIQNVSSLKKSVNATSTEIKSKHAPVPHQAGGLFDEFSTSHENLANNGVGKVNGLWNSQECNHIESSSNNNSVGDGTEYHLNHIGGDDSDDGQFGSDMEEQDTNHHSFKLHCSPPEDTLDLRVPSPTAANDVTDNLGHDMQGGHTAKFNSVSESSLDNSTSGNQSSHTGGVDELQSEPVDVGESQVEQLENINDDDDDDDDDDDEFGQFSFSSNALNESKPPSSLENAVPHQSISSLATSDNLDIERPHEDITKDKETIDDDSRTREDSFGDFNSGPIVIDNNCKKTTDGGTSQFCTTTVNHETDIPKTLHLVDDDEESSLGKPEPPEFPDHDQDEEEDDGFGDFGSFSKPSATVESFSDSQSTHVSSANVGDSSDWNTDDHDDFGGFGSFESTPSTKVLSSQAEFGGFESVQKAPGNFSQSGSTLSSTNRTVDDFGDFGTFQQDKGGDDDFGDFGSFSSSKTVSASDDPASTRASHWTMSKPTQVRINRIKGVMI